MRRVIQIDVNDDSEKKKEAEENTIGFLEKNQLEAVDHNKHYFRLNFDVNFRNIDLINILPIDTEIQKDLFELRDISSNSEAKEKELFQENKSAMDLNFKIDKPQNTEALIKTHTKFYTVPVFSEI